MDMKNEIQLSEMVISVLHQCSEKEKLTEELLRIGRSLIKSSEEYEELKGKFLDKNLMGDDIKAIFSYVEEKRKDKTNLSEQQEYEPSEESHI